MNKGRRQLLSATLLAAVTPFAHAALDKPVIEVWKSPSCGCCKDWVAHLEKDGFSVKVNDSGNNVARARLGMPTKYGSCHTGLVSGYAVEGHVPAREIHRLLKEKPQAVGLSGAGYANRLAWYGRA